VVKGLSKRAIGWDNSCVKGITGWELNSVVQRMCEWENVWGSYCVRYSTTCVMYKQYKRIADGDITVLADTWTGKAAEL
jgi:hypothetical protein